ncbi:MAG TPA: patatin-like phospholipase family protein, partial [Chitinophaga sp.]
AIPLFLVMLLGLNIMVQSNMIDNRNKAYGLDYREKTHRPVYSPLALQHFFTEEKRRVDVDSGLAILRRWRAKFPADRKPLLVVMNFSGGGSRSALWSMNVLQRLDTLLQGLVMQHTVMMTGASGGMMGASYFRELFYEQQLGQPVRLSDTAYTERISRDLLNPVFTALAVNDFITPFRRFRIRDNYYAKDRGYAFERQLNRNTHQVLNRTLGEYYAPEAQGLIPMLVWNATINADGRRLMISPQRISYLCAPEYLYPTRAARDIDGVDFGQYFARQRAMELQVTSAIRMSATFPYVLPNVYLPSNPIVDVMDAGIRDNFGQETTLRYLYTFRRWINENTAGIVYVQVRDTRKNEITRIKESQSLGDLMFAPLFTMQAHWSAMQDFNQDHELNYLEGYFPNKFHRVIFQYVPQQENKAAAMSLHLNSREKLDIGDALDNPTNQSAFHYVQQLFDAEKPRQ